MVKVKVSESKRLRAILKRLPDICTDTLKRTTAENGKTLSDDMESRCPEGPTGKLRASIGFRVSNDGLTAYVGFDKRVFPKLWSPPNAGWRAHFTEFGTRGTTGTSVTTANVRRVMGLRIRRAHAATRAQPFIFPALRANIDLMLELQKDGVREAINRAAGMESDDT